MVMRYKLAWIGTGIEADILAGPDPPTFEIQIGSRFAVWSELDFNSGQYDIFAYDLDSELKRRITSTPDVDETAPATSGAWIVWQQKAHGATATTIQAYNQDTHASVTVAANGAGNFNPSIDGDLITWESNVAGNLDIWLYRMSTGETFQVTTEEHDQYLNNVFADMVAYVDMRRGSEDVYVSHLKFIPDNQPPSANAGTDQTVHAGSLVTLDGTGSTDPDGNLPLTYAWTIVSMPAGSGASLSDPTSATPSFIADKYGEYLLSLTVTDSLGLSSTADDVLISTSNSAPFADAGADQAVVLVGTTVHLDGSGSYDPDGDPITYQWSFISTPAGSTATLDGATTATPSFLADKYGTYEIQLVVADPWASSADTVVVSFNNVAPVADAGRSGTSVVGQTVTLDGRASYDANGDALTYQWGFTFLPEGSAAAIFEPTAAVTTFVPDLPGLYVVQLVVSDGMFNSDPSTIQVQVISQQSAAVNAINAIIESVGSLEPGDLKNANMQNALINKLNAVIASIEAGSYADALDKLQNDLLKKTDGCATGGEPDKNDWIKNCEAQVEVYPFIIAAIATIGGL
jgi:beta propeller repeat protein